MDIETITTPADAGGSGGQETKTEAQQPDSGSKKTDETPAERKFKLKFGKTEREVGEAEALMLAQKGWASDEKFKQAKALERQVKDALKNGDVDYLIKQMKGKDKIEFAKEVLRAELAKRQMSPEELEIQERKDRLDRLRREEAELTNKREKEKLDAAQRHYEEQYDKELAEAITKHNLPKNKYVIGRAIKIASEIVDMGLDPDWNLVVGEAKRQVQDEMGVLLDQLDDFGFVGEERARKISKWLVNKGMPKRDADKQALKVVKQEDKTPDNAPVDSDEYWEKKRAQWSK